MSPAEQGPAEALKPTPAKHTHREVPVRPDPPAPSWLPRLTEQELFERLGWFVSIRWAAGVAALLLVLIAWHGFGVRIPPRPVVITICALFMYNALFLLLVTDAYRRHKVSRRFILGCANGQILCDLLTLAVLMHFTGGVENPFLIFSICPLVIASQLLAPRNAYAYAALGAVLIQAVAWAEYAGVLTHVAVGEATGAETYRSALTVAKFSIALSLLGFATVFLGSSIGSRLRQREAQLERAYAQLQELERSKSFLMRQTSHDLRAPLDALISVLRVVLVEARKTCSPRLVDMIGRVEQRALGLTHLIDELHRYAILRDAVATMRKQPTDLATAVLQSVRLYTLMAQERDLRLRSTIESVVVDGNAEALAELTGNLLTNAIQYTRPGGEIHVALRRADSVAELQIRDTGVGIPPEALGRVFDEFYRATNAKEVFRSGTGMGLPIVRRIVEAHGGTIQVDSTLGQGTTFTITLPALN